MSVVIALLLSPALTFAGIPDPLPDPDLLPPLLLEPAEYADMYGNPVTRPNGYRLSYFPYSDGRWYVYEEDQEGRFVGEYLLDGPFGDDPDAKKEAPATESDGALLDKPQLTSFSNQEPALRMRRVFSGQTEDYGSAGIHTADFDGDGTIEILEGHGDALVVANKLDDGSWISYGPGLSAPGREYRESEIRFAEEGESTVEAVYTILTHNHLRRYDSLDGSVRWDVKLPSVWGRHYQLLEIADLDGDGNDEVIVAGPRLFVLDAETGELERELTSTGFRRFYDLALGDIDGDKKLELIVTGHGDDFVLDAETFDTKWRAELGFRITTGDLNGDGVSEILTWDSDRTPIMAAWDGRSRKKIWELERSRRIADGVILDYDGDGLNEIAWVDSQWGSVHLAYGHSGEEILTYPNPTYGAASLVRADLDQDGRDELLWSWDFEYWVNAPPALFHADFHRADPLELILGSVPFITAHHVGDATGDGIPNLILSRWNRWGVWDLTLEVRDVATGKLLAGPEALGAGDKHANMNAITLGDVDGDGETEIILGGIQSGAGVLRVLDGSTLALKWEYQGIGLEGMSLGSLGTAQLDNDPALEILAGNVYGEEASGAFISAFDYGVDSILWRSVHVGDNHIGSLVNFDVTGSGAELRIATVGRDAAMHILDREGRVLVRPDIDQPIGDTVVFDPIRGRYLLQVVTAEGELVIVDPRDGAILSQVPAEHDGIPDALVALPSGYSILRTIDRIESSWHSPEVYRVSIVSSTTGAKQDMETVLSFGDQDLSTLEFADSGPGLGREASISLLHGVVFLSPDNCPEHDNPYQMDRDGDGIGDACDTCPDMREDAISPDLDGDGDGAACDADDDGDGVDDVDDNCPWTANSSQLNSDADHFGDACDLCPVDDDPRQLDSDGDGSGDVCDPDDDDDLIPDEQDLCPEDPRPAPFDTDGDGIGDTCDPDDDNDGVPDAIDNCPFTANPSQTDTFWDLLGDACTTDYDGDNHPNNNDNCPHVANPDQEDWDRDGTGDACDLDQDGDGAPNGIDVCPNYKDWLQLDTNNDGIGDRCSVGFGADFVWQWRHPNHCVGRGAELGGSADIDGDGTLEWLTRPDGALNALPSWSVYRWNASLGQPHRVMTLLGKVTGFAPVAQSDSRKGGIVQLVARKNLRFYEAGDVHPTAMVDTTSERPPTRIHLYTRDLDGDGLEELIYMPAGRTSATVRDARTLHKRGEIAISSTSHLNFGDVEGDGISDIITNNGSVYDGRTRRLKYSPPLRATSVLGVFDADQDGADEILLMMDTSIGLWDIGRDGFTWLRKRAGYGHSDLFVTDNGRREILIYKRRRLVALDVENGALLRDIAPIPSGAWTMADFDNDGKLEIAFKEGWIDAESGEFEWRVPLQTVAIPNVAALDLDTDGTTDLAVATCGHSIGRLDLASGQFRGIFLGENADSKGGVADLSSGDINANGMAELLVSRLPFSSSSAYLSALSIPDGQEIWRVSDLPGSRIHRTPLSPSLWLAGDYDSALIEARRGLRWIDLPSPPKFSTLLELDQDQRVAYAYYSSVADNRLRVIIPLSGEVIASERTESLSALTFMRYADGRGELLAGTETGFLVGYDPETLEELHSVYLSPGRAIKDIVALPGRRAVAVLMDAVHGDDHYVFVVDLENSWIRSKLEFSGRIERLKLEHGSDGRWWMFVERNGPTEAILLNLCVGRPIEFYDADGDGIGNRCDRCPLVSNILQSDADGDRLGDACDDDDDNDGVPDEDDNCPLRRNRRQFDRDQDGFGNLCDLCPDTPNTSQADFDGDGRAAACDDDDDGDGVPDESDLCPEFPDGSGGDIDGDGVGDACDPDRDGDGAINAWDSCASVPSSANTDFDFDGDGDDCDRDDDNDGLLDVDDSCITAWNAEQLDLDQDGIGDECDPDRDGDGVAFPDDLCPAAVNPLQLDEDQDGRGDVCDETPSGRKLQAKHARWLAVTGRQARTALVRRAGKELIAIARDYEFALFETSTESPHTLTQVDHSFRERAVPYSNETICSLGSGNIAGDADDELVVLRKRGELAVFGSDGRMLSSTRLGDHSEVCSAGTRVEVIDIEGDQRMEIVASLSRKLVVLDALTLEIRGEVRTITQGFATGDVDGDGDLDFLVRSPNRHASILWVDGSTLRPHAEHLLPGMRHFATISSQTGSQADVIAAFWTDSGTTIRTVRLGESYSGETLVHLPDRRCRWLEAGPSRPGAYRPVIAGIFERTLYPGEDRQSLVVMDASSGEILLDIEQTARPAIIWRRCQIADVDDDGDPEFIVSPPWTAFGLNGDNAIEWAIPGLKPGSEMLLAKGSARSGDEESHYTLFTFLDDQDDLHLDVEDGAGRPLASHVATASSAPYQCALGDGDGDGSPEMLVSDRSGTRAWRLDGQGGLTLLSPAFDRAGTTLSFADFTGDERPEILIGSRELRVLDGATYEDLYRFEPLTHYIKCTASWPTRGRATHVLATTDYVAYLFDAATGEKIAERTFTRYLGDCAWTNEAGQSHAHPIVASRYGWGGNSDRIHHLDATTLELLRTEDASTFFRRFAHVPVREDLLAMLDTHPRRVENWPSAENEENFSLALPYGHYESLLVEDFDGDRHHEALFTEGGTRLLLRYKRTVHPPRASFGPHGEFECTAPLSRVLFDGRLSSDADSTPGTRDDLLRYSWLEKDEEDQWTPIAGGETFERELSLGLHEIGLEVEDSGYEVDQVLSSLHVVDTVPPEGAINSPAADACIGPSGLPVQIGDSYSDLCDLHLSREYQPEGGASIETHGDHLVRLGVEDDSGNRSESSVDFVIDLVAPEARFLDSWAQLLVGQQEMPVSRFIATSDEDGASGEPVLERLSLDECVFLDGGIDGDRDGRLIDEVLSKDTNLLCQIMQRCGRDHWNAPVLKLEVTDCGGNLAHDQRVFPGTLRIPPRMCD